MLPLLFPLFIPLGPLAVAMTFNFSDASMRGYTAYALATGGAPIQESAASAAGALAAALESGGRFVPSLRRSPRHISHGIPPSFSHAAPYAWNGPDEILNTPPFLHHLQLQLGHLGVTFGPGGLAITETRFRPLFRLPAAGASGAGSGYSDGAIHGERVAGKDLLGRILVVVEFKTTAEVDTPAARAQALYEISSAQEATDPSHRVLLILTDGMARNYRMYMSGKNAMFSAALSWEVALLREAHFLNLVENRAWASSPGPGRPPPPPTAAASGRGPRAAPSARAASSSGPPLHSTAASGLAEPAGEAPPGAAALSAKEQDLKVSSP